MSDTPNGPAMQVEDLRKHYPLRGSIFSRVTGHVKAVDGVSFTLRRGETLAIVGESGCGKSTLGRALMRLEEPTAGRVLLAGKDMASADSRELFALRRHLQMIFQDPYSSLNPRMTAGDIVREPLVIHRLGNRAEREERARSLMRSVGLSDEMMNRYPHEFSGGQRQRIGIARALALEPNIIVADEPVSALDVSVQAQVLNLMVQLQRDRGLTYIFISHDLGVVEYIADTIAVMYLGRFVEIGPKAKVFAAPAHPYTRALMASSPIPDPRLRRAIMPITGELPSPVNPPAGCPFHPRCPFAIDRCKQAVPPLEPSPGAADADHRAACIRQNELPAFQPVAVG